MRMKKKIVVGLGSVLGLVLLAQVAMFFAVKWKWTNVAGAVDIHNDAFGKVAMRVAEVKEQPATIQRKIDALSAYTEYNATMIDDAYARTRSQALAEYMVEAVVLRLEESDPTIRGVVAKGAKHIEVQQNKGDSETAFPWMQTEDWEVFRDAIVKDKKVIERAAREADVEPRLIVTQLVAEQLRLFNSSRESFKKFFAPLRILGNETKFSWGVTGIKEDTAIQIEEHLTDKTSAFWPGEKYEHLLDFKTDQEGEERFNRITAKDHYFAYLYTALYVKEITKQWEYAGYDISHRPDILATLYNIGFDRSKPKVNPAVGGAEITIADNQYSFGSIGFEFYFSGELDEEFPYEIWR